MNTAQLVRALTQGEAAMVRALFGGAVDCSRVRVYRRPYLPFGLQPRNCAMTPNGSLYFHDACCLDDFSRGDVHARHWFIHEMVHVWQHQLGYPVRMRGALRLGLSYRYELDAGRRLADFNMEAQGDLLADYFALAHLGAPAALSQPRFAHTLHLFEQVLHDFLRAPASPANLPMGLAGRFARWRAAGAA